jgi:hypothetical protein
MKIWSAYSSPELVAVTKEVVPDSSQIKSDVTHEIKEKFKSINLSSGGFESSD